MDKDSARLLVDTAFETVKNLNKSHPVVLAVVGIVQKAVDDNFDLIWSHFFAKVQAQHPTTPPVTY